MSHARPARRRLAAAVVTVVAVTVGSTALAVPANAVPAAEGAAASDVTTTQDVIAIPRGTTIFGATATGYLTSNPDSAYRTWIRASDGASSGGGWMYYVGVEATGQGDLGVVNTNGRTVSDAVLTDMATGQQLFTVSHNFNGHDYVGAADRTLFTTVDNASGGKDLRMHTLGARDTATTGLPVGATGVDVSAGVAGHGLVTYSTGTGEAVKRYVGMIDLATGTVAEQHERAGDGDVAVSATHLAWVEYDAADNATVVTVDRATKTAQRFKVGNAWRNDVEVGLVGDWVTYGVRSGLKSEEPSPLNALTARSLKDGVTTRTLLDHALSAAVAPDGAQIVRGGTAAQDEGLYRVAPGADGAPAATLVASTGEATEVTMVGHKIPTTIDLDKNGGRFPLEWQVSRHNVRVKAVLRHVRTGRTREFSDLQIDNGLVRFDWSGDLTPAGSTPHQNAYNGDYTWTLTTQPMSGVGPAHTASGTFTVVRKPAAHDFNDNGSPDVLLRTASGRLYRVDTYFDPYNPWLSPAEEKFLGEGWNGYNQIEAAGNIGGAAHADLVTRDTAGVLWLHLGNGDGTFATRYKIATGFGGYNKIAAGSDLNGDGRADLVATDTAGAMWVYKGTGNWRTPFTTRVKISTGWNGYNQITATGNIAGGTAGDLVARDGAGVLWLYLGKGDGTFASRVKIGGGWGGYSHIVGIGDGNRDGRADLYATNSADNRTYLYKGTGSWSAPFAQRQDATLPNNRPTSVA